MIAWLVHRMHGERGFTLIELLVVLAILGLLIAIALLGREHRGVERPQLAADADRGGNADGQAEIGGSPAAMIAAAATGYCRIRPWRPFIVPHPERQAGRRAGAARCSPGAVS